MALRISRPETSPRALPSGRVSRARRLLTGALAALTTTATLAAALQPSRAVADPVATATGGRFTIAGQGFGHGHGMSQWGAYGAAHRGRSWQQILGFYYRGTTLASQPANARIRVWISADTDNSLQLDPTWGLSVRDAHGHALRLPSGPGYRSWLISRSGSGFKLSYLNAAGHWTALTGTKLDTSTWTASSSKRVRLVLPSGTVAEYRGAVSLVRQASGARVVDTVSVEDYLRGVVPAEMPTSWAMPAVQAQAVAARTFAASTAATSGRSRNYDICDTTACQVYQPYAQTSRGRRWHNETDRGNAAIAATAHRILTYRGAPALTQFSASNGGWEAAGGLPYLPSQADPYDAVMTANSWSRTVSAATLQHSWPSAGTVRGVRVVQRDGHGRWGGRVTSVAVVGSSRTVTVSGAGFAAVLGLGSTLFEVS